MQPMEIVEPSLYGPITLFTGLDISTPLSSMIFNFLGGTKIEKKVRALIVKYMYNNSIS